MTISATELKQNLSKYMELSKSEDVIVTKNGKTLTVLTNPYMNKRKIVESLFGAAPGNVTLEDAKEERSKNL